MNAILVRIGAFFFVCLMSAGHLVAGQEPAPAPAQAPSTGSQTPAAPGPGPQDPRYALNVDVELVNITATVLDQNGRYFEGLGMGDFRIFENGEEQKVSFFSHDLRVPVSVGVLVDISGSMRHKLQQALQTVREVVQAISGQDEMFLVTFNDSAKVVQPLTSDVQVIQSALRSIRSSGETAVYDAISLSMREMAKAKHDKKILILVTDGFDSRSRINLTQVEDMLKRSEVLVYAIGIDDDDNDPEAQRRTRYHIYHYMLNRLATLGGGRVFRMFTGRNYAMDTLAETLLDELHQQYTLSYYPTSVGEDTWREVEIRVTKEGSQIRHRPGYFATLRGGSIVDD